MDEIATNLDTEKSELMSEVKKLRAMPKEDVSIKQQRGERRGIIFDSFIHLVCSILLAVLVDSQKRFVLFIFRQTPRRSQSVERRARKVASGKQLFYHRFLLGCQKKFLLKCL